MAPLSSRSLFVSFLPMLCDLLKSSHHPSFQDLIFLPKTSGCLYTLLTFAQYFVAQIPMYFSFPPLGHPQPILHLPYCKFHLLNLNPCIARWLRLLQIQPPHALAWKIVSIFEVHPGVLNLERFPWLKMTEFTRNRKRLETLTSASKIDKVAKQFKNIQPSRFAVSGWKYIMENNRKEPKFRANAFPNRSNSRIDNYDSNK